MKTSSRPASVFGGGAALLAWFAIPTTAAGQAPANDNIANAAPVAALPFSDLGSTVLATAEANEPDHASSIFGNEATNSVWWEWTATADGFVTVLVESAGEFDSVLAVYAGDPISGGGTAVVAADQFGELGDEQAAFDALQGTTYYFAVDGYFNTGEGLGWDGDFALEVETVENRPDNDAFADARVLPSTLPATDSGTTLAATAEAGEPDHANAAIGANLATDSVWWSWEAPVSGPVAVWVQGDAFDAVLAVYAGMSVAALVEVQSAEGFIENGSEELTFVAMAGTTYHIAVDAYSGSGQHGRFSGPFDLIVAAPPGNDDFANATDLGNALPAQSTGQSTIGATEESASGEPEHARDDRENLASNSVWYTWTSPVNGPVRVMAANPVFDNALAVYTGSALDALASVAFADLYPENAADPVYFDAVQGTEYIIAVDGHVFGNSRDAFQSGMFDLLIESAPPNDRFADAELIVGALPVTTPGTTVGGFHEIDGEEPFHAFEIEFNVPSNSVWFAWTPAAPVSVRIDVRNAAFNSVLAVYTGTTLPTLDLERESDNFVQGIESVIFDAQGGTTYFIAVDGFSETQEREEEGTFDLVISESLPLPYDNWIALFPSLTGPDALRGANPAGDGIPNILKLVFGLNPTLQVGNDPNAANAPMLTTFNGNVAIQYHVVPGSLGTGPDAITHSAEATNDLQSWSSAPPVNTEGNTWVLELPPGAQGGMLYGRIVADDPNAP